jgi:hypothetical protein
MAAETPIEILKVLRQRNGLDENDASTDDELNAQSPEQKFREVITWHLGDGSWAGSILSWAAQCGVKLDN